MKCNENIDAIPLGRRVNIAQKNLQIFPSRETWTYCWSGPHISLAFAVLHFQAATMEYCKLSAYIA